jgi:hypothetical protein
MQNITLIKNIAIILKIISYYVYLVIVEKEKTIKRKDKKINLKSSGSMDSNQSRRKILRFPFDIYRNEPLKQGELNAKTVSRKKCRTQKLASANIQDILVEHDAILAKFPDATCNSYGGFYSKSVNQNYNKTSFHSTPYGLTLYLFHELEFINAQGQKELTRIQSSAKQSYQLIWVSWNRELHRPDMIHFINIAQSFKKYKVKGEPLMADISVELMQYIRQHPQYKVDSSNLDIRLKKLIAFV